MGIEPREVVSGPAPSPGSASTSGPRTVRRVLLVGFMGSGKTQVGQALARELGWSFRDFDQEIKSRVGLPIPEIFSQRGEGFFRQVEERVGVELLAEEKVVLASGGGWPAALGRMESLPEDTLAVWLRVDAGEAVRRVREEGPTRPLLAVEDPVAAARELLGKREVFYRRAHLSTDTVGRQPEELARWILDRMGHRSGGSAPAPDTVGEDRPGPNRATP